MDENLSFGDLMARLEAGSDDAALRVFQLYGQRLIALARSRMDPRIRQKLDPEDVVQSVFRSFFTRQSGGEYDLNDWNGLWALLVRITINKCINQSEGLRTQGRNVALEVPAQAGDSTAADWGFVDRQPGPEEAAILRDTMVEAMRGFDVRDCLIIERWLQGSSQREIAAELEAPRTSVQRVIDRVTKRLQRMLSDDAPL